MVNIGLIGCGAWGINYINTLYSIPEVMIHSICDISEAQLEKFKRNYPTIKKVTDYREILQDDHLAGVIIATPPHSHYEIAADFLSHRKAVLVEKPFTLCYQEAAALIKLAKSNNTTLMSGHLMEYHPAVLKMQEHINQGLAGELRYMLLERTSLGKVRQDVSVLWDLAVHDLSMVRYLVNKNPLWVAAQGESYLQPNIYDLVTITMQFPANLFVQIHANWLCPLKKRQVVISGDKATMVFDDIKNDYKLQLIHSNGEITQPRPDKALPLTNQCLHFVDCIKSKAAPLTGAADILWVIKVMSLVEQSLANNGARIFADWSGGELC